MKLSLNWLKDYIDPKLSTEELAERLTMAGFEVEAVESVAGDTVLEMEITPNRPDALSILGLAREIGAITGKTVKAPKIKGYVIPAKAGISRKRLRSPIKVLACSRPGQAFGDDNVCVENKKDCSRYIATLIRGARITDAPQGMKQRLVSLGINAVNNAVDITNFVLMETGQPLHAFDYDKLAGGKVVIRRARDGEALVTLDGIERKLDASILVIADAQKPVAIAGIMGGRDTQITAATKNILLESAHFDMGLVRRASRAQGLRSDSSYRFERNVNFEGVLTGANRATDLLLQLTGGKLSGRAEICQRQDSGFRRNDMRPVGNDIGSKIKVKVSDIESLLGVEVTPLKVKSWLAKLGFIVTLRKNVIPAKAGSHTGHSQELGILTVTPPGNRGDIQQDVDVIEEIARMIGFDRLPSSLPMIKTINIPVDKRPREVKDRIRRVLTAGGIDEIITLSMINTKALVNSNMAEMPAVRIFNPLSQDQELMRPGMLPSFLQVTVTNFNRGQKDLGFFEIGKIYFKNKERETLGILLTGRRAHDWRSSKKDVVDTFDLKGVLERIFQNVGIGAVYETTQTAAFDPACAAAILINGKQIGVLGKIEKQVLNNWDIKYQDVYFAEVYLDGLLSLPDKPLKYRPVSEFPAIVRDVSLAVKKEIPYKKIEEICFQQGGDILRAVHFIEQYVGDKIQSGTKGLVFSCHYQSNTRTLREDEVSAVHERILQALIHDLSAIRR